LAHYNAKPVLVVLRPSYLLAGLIAFAALSSALVVLTTYIAWWIKLAACVVIAFPAIYHVQQALIRFNRSWASIAVNINGELILRRQDGNESSPVKLLPGSFVASYLMILQLKIPDSRWTQYLLLMPDSTDDQSLRQLRMWLLWGWNNRDETTQDKGQPV